MICPVGRILFPLSVQSSQLLIRERERPLKEKWNALLPLFKKNVQITALLLETPTGFLAQFNFSSYFICLNG